MSNFIYISSAAPTNYNFFAAYASNTTFTVPQSGWYRIYCIGKSGDGGPPSGGNNIEAGRGGGGSGGVSVSNLLLSTGIPISLTFTNGIASFGSYLYATPGGNGQDDYGGSAGVGYNGNVANYTGFVGGAGGPREWKRYIPNAWCRAMPGEDGLNGGLAGGSGGESRTTTIPAGGGGGGSRLPGSEICRYISPEYTDTNFGRAGCGASNRGSSGNADTNAGRASFLYPDPVLNSTLILYGGGGGGGGRARDGAGGANGYGSPAVIVVERQV